MIYTVFKGVKNFEKLSAQCTYKVEQGNLSKLYSFFFWKDIFLLLQFGACDKYVVVVFSVL